MIHEPQPNAPAGALDRDRTEPCTACGADVVADPVDGGLNCARCGQWQVLCESCMPNLSDYARDAVWRCPECAEKPLDS